MPIGQDEAQALREGTNQALITSAAAASSSIQALDEISRVGGSIEKLAESVLSMGSDVKESAMLNSHMNGRLEGAESTLERYKSREMMIDETILFIKKTAWIIIFGVGTAVVSQVISIKNSVPSSVLDDQSKLVAKQAKLIERQMQLIRNMEKQNQDSK